METRLWSWFFPVLAAILILALSGNANAQTSQASVRGVIHDASGALVPDAHITLRNTETQVTNTTQSSAAGDYLFLNVNPGTYTLEANSPGFVSEKLKPFLLQVNQTSKLDFTLAAGGGSEVVEVDAVGAGVQASTAEVGLTLGTKQIADLPLNTRNFTALLTTTPGVSPVVVSGSQSASYTTAVGPVIIPSFNGQTNRSDLFVIDGVLDTETFGNAYAVQPIIDAIQDMKMQSHNDSAEFGGSTGGTINISTKSGTNTLHGSAWEFYKSPSLNAVPRFSTQVNPQRQHQYGGALGGPVVIPHFYNGRNRSFFFGSYEGYRLNAPNTVYLRVPTTAELAGDFRADSPIYDPFSTTCTAAGVCTRQQFAYNGLLNTINPSRLNQGAIYYAQSALPGVAPAGTVLTGTNNAFQNAPTVQSLYSYDIRGDQTLTAKDSVFFRFMTLRGSQTSGREQLPTSTITKAYSYVASYVHIFGASSSLHAQFGRTYEQRGILQRFTGVPADLATRAGFPANLSNDFSNLPNAIPAFSVDSHFGDLGDFSNPTVSADSYSYKVDYTQVLGRHTFKVGAEFNGIGESQQIQWGQEGFNVQETNSLRDGSLGTSTGDAAASYILGVPYGFTKRNVDETIGFGGLLGVYLQDQFQVTPSLTLNAGLRYDLAFIPKYGSDGNPNQYVGNFDFNNGTYVVLKTPASCASLGTAPCIPTTNGALPDHVVASPDGKLLQNQYNNLQPRLGLAYRVDPRTALRLGIGLAFDNYAGLVQNLRGISGNWPSVSQISQSNINAPTAANPTPRYSIASLPALTALPAATPFNQFNWFIDPNHKDAYSVQYNLGVQHQLDAHTVATATYVGSVNRRLDVGGNYNVALTPGAGDPVARRPYPYITPTFYSRSNGRGSYNSLQLQLSRTFSKGLAATVAYTWAKSLDQGCSGFFGSEGCSVQQIYNIKAEKGVSAFDVPQNFTATFNYQLPIGRGKSINVQNRLLDALVAGWQVNGFIHLNSGRPFSPSLSPDIANIGATGYERPNLLGNPRRQISAAEAVRTNTSWLNPAAFSIPAQYTYGNAGRNSLRSPFYKSLDSSVFKEFNIYDRLHARFAFETFNTFNHPTFGTPNGNFSNYNAGNPSAANSTFGQITSTASDPRSVQISAKIIF